MATATAYTEGIKAFTNKELDWDTDNFSALLLKDTYSMDQDGDEFVSDVVSGNEPSGGSYARVALTGKAISSSSGVVKLTADDIVFASMTQTDIQYMLVFRDTGLDSTSKLISVVDIGATLDPTAQTITFALNVDGVLNLTV